MTTKKKAVVAMSGGVDSSVAAALMVEAGYDVTGVMLKLWRGEAANNNSGCCNLGAAEDARRVADVLGIPFYVFNFAERFEDSVIRNFHDDYVQGRTPNPCVRCNQWIKFDALLDRARALEADVLVTGHYARVRHENDRYRLLRGVDSRKDQSYVLWMLDQDALAMCRFPIGEMEKAHTRALAAELGLRTAGKPDSQEICFVRAGDLDAYIGENVAQAARPGPVVTPDGEVVGEHRGIARYTIGQRKGLEVALGMPVFVTHIDADTNTIVVGERGDLAVARVGADEISFVHSAPAPGDEVLAQYRAHGDVYEAVVADVASTEIALDFPTPAQAVAPGQSVALYSKERPEELIGGGIISSTVPARAVA